MNQANLRRYIKAFLDSCVGEPHTITLNFNSDFVTGNVISGDINSTDFLDVTYATSHAATLQELAFALQVIPAVRTAKITGARQITVVGYVTNTTLTATISTTGGATQPTLTQTTVTAASSVPVLRQYVKFEQYTEQCVFRVLTSVPYGIDGYRNIDPDTNLSLLVGNRIATITVDYTGPYAIEKISRIYQELYSERARIYFQNYEMSVSRRESIKDLTELQETEWQERASFDFYLRYFDTTEEDLSTIETVTIDGTIDEVPIEQIIIT